MHIKSVQKTDRTDPHERILGIGGEHDDGSRWYLPQAEAVDGIEAGRWRFWMIAQGSYVPVVVATHMGCKYLKTEGDETHPDSLLALPEEYP